MTHLDGIATITSISIERPLGDFLQDDATTMMKLDLDPNSSSKDSAEECKGAAKGASDAGGKVRSHKDASYQLSLNNKFFHYTLKCILLRRQGMASVTHIDHMDIGVQIHIIALIIACYIWTPLDCDIFWFRCPPALVAPGPPWCQCGGLGGSGAAVLAAAGLAS